MLIIYYVHTFLKCSSSFNTGTLHYWSHSSDGQRVLVMILWKINASIEPCWGFHTNFCITSPLLEAFDIWLEIRFWAVFLLAFFELAASGALLLYMTCLLSSQWLINYLLSCYMLVQFQKPSQQIATYVQSNLNASNFMVVYLTYIKVIYFRTNPLFNFIHLIS